MAAVPTVRLAEAEPQAAAVVALGTTWAHVEVHHALATAA